MLMIKNEGLRIKNYDYHNKKDYFIPYALISYFFN